MSSETTVVWPDSFLWVFHSGQRSKGRSGAQSLRRRLSWEGHTLSKGIEGVLSTQAHMHAPFRNLKAK